MNRRHYIPCPECGKAMTRRAYRCRACSPLIRGERHYAWKGDAALHTTKRTRVANPKIPAGTPCRDCQGTAATERHHIDGDPGNNHVENIAFLCRRCHMLADGRLARRDERGRFARAS